MANASKRKGDRAERELAECLRELVDARYLARTPRRALGAGRADDIGDIDALPDVAIQAKAYSDLAAAVRAAVADGARNARNAGVPWWVGAVLVPRQRLGSPTRWLAVSTTWPLEREPDAYCASARASVTWLLACAHRPYVTAMQVGKQQVLAGWLPTWVADYAAARDHSERMSR